MCRLSLTLLPTALLTSLEQKDTDSDDDVALAVRNLGNLDDLVAHLKGFMGELIGEAKLREMGNDS